MILQPTSGTRERGEGEEEDGIGGYEVRVDSDNGLYFKGSEGG